MNKRKLSKKLLVATTTVFLSLGVGLSFAANGDTAKQETPGGMPLTAAQQVKGGSKAAPSKPSSAQLAAKREMVRKQQEQRVTDGKRKAAAENLKAERLKVYKARQAVKQTAP